MRTQVTGAHSGPAVTDLLSARAAVTAETAEHQQREARERQAIERALAAQRRQLEDAIRAFLQAAQHIHPTTTPFSNSIGPGRLVYAEHSFMREINTDRDVYVSRSGHVLYVGDGARPKLSRSFTGQPTPRGLEHLSR
jgi:hypothetical protein